MTHTYEDYFNAAKEIFQPDALINHQGWYFDLDGEVLFGPRCGYIILQYDKENLFIPYRLELEDNGRIRPKEKDREATAMDIATWRKVKDPSLSLFKEECYNYLQHMKELKQKLREQKIQKDF